MTVLTSIYSGQPANFGKHNATLFSQDMAIINEDNLPMFNRCGVMALVAAYLNFLSQMIAVPAFCQHVTKVTRA